MTEHKIEKQIDNLENNLRELKAYKRLRKEAKDSAKQLDIVVKEYEKYGFSREEIFQLLVASFKNK